MEMSPLEEAAVAVLKLHELARGAPEDQLLALIREAAESERKMAVVGHNLGDGPAINALRAARAVLGVA